MELERDSSYMSLSELKEALDIWKAEKGQNDYKKRYLLVSGTVFAIMIICILFGLYTKYPKQVSITDDLRARSGYSYNDTGKMVYIHKSYCSDMSKWIRKDLNADGTPEYLTYLPNGQMLILTIYNNRVRVLAVLQTGWGGPDVYYNKKTNTFTVVSRINARTISRNVYKIRNGKLYRIATLSDYVGMVMNINGYQPIYRYLNGKKVSKTKYYRYYNKYCTGMQHIEWNASQG